jgi:hypothetical protein
MWWKYIMTIEDRRPRRDSRLYGEKILTSRANFPYHRNRGQTTDSSGSKYCWGRVGPYSLWSNERPLPAYRLRHSLDIVAYSLLVTCVSHNNQCSWLCAYYHMLELSFFFLLSHQSQALINLRSSLLCREFFISSWRCCCSRLLIARGHWDEPWRWASSNEERLWRRWHNSHLCGDGENDEQWWWTTPVIQTAPPKGRLAIIHTNATSRARFLFSQPRLLQFFPGKCYNNNEAASRGGCWKSILQAVSFLSTKRCSSGECFKAAREMGINSYMLLYILLYMPLNMLYMCSYLCSYMLLFMIQYAHLCCITLLGSPRFHCILQRNSPMFHKGHGWEYGGGIWLF